MLSTVIVGLLALTDRACAEANPAPRNADSKAQPTIEPFYESVDFAIPLNIREPTTLPRMAVHLVESAVPEGEDFAPLYYSGTDLEKKGIAGVCTDGTFLWYSSFDCGGKCKCDSSGKVSSDTPSGCGPQKDVVNYCVDNPLFKCDCLSGTLNADKIQRDETSLGQFSNINANINDINDLAAAAPKLQARSDAEEDEEEGIPMISPCFYDPAESCGPYTPESRRTDWPRSQATTLVKVVK